MSASPVMAATETECGSDSLIAALFRDLGSVGAEQMFHVKHAGAHWTDVAGDDRRGKVHG
jgi:hypothetical protein